MADGVEEDEDYTAPFGANDENKALDREVWTRNSLFLC